jgi:putative transposase
MCRVLKVSRRGYYSWARRPSESPRQQSDRELLGQIGSIHRDSRGTYGSPRIHAALRALEQRVRRKRVARLMRQDGLAGKIRRRIVVTTDFSHGLPVAPNILDRDFNPDAPD